MLLKRHAKAVPKPPPQQLCACRGMQGACKPATSSCHSISVSCPLKLRKWHHADPEPIHPDRRPIKVFRCFCFVTFFFVGGPGLERVRIFAFFISFSGCVNQFPQSWTVFTHVWQRINNCGLKTSFPFRDIGGVTVFPGLRQACLRQGLSAGHTCAKHS